MEPRTFTEKDLSPDGPGGCVWEGEEEMDSAFLFMFFMFVYTLEEEKNPLGFQVPKYVERMCMGESVTQAHSYADRGQAAHGN